MYTLMYTLNDVYLKLINYRNKLDMELKIIKCYFAQGIELPLFL